MVVYVVLHCLKHLEIGWHLKLSLELRIIHVFVSEVDPNFMAAN